MYTDTLDKIICWAVVPAYFTGLHGTDVARLWDHCCCWQI